MRTRVRVIILLALLPACSAASKWAASHGEPRLEVISCRIAAVSGFVDVRFRLSGSGTFDPEPATTYLLDEATGQRFPIVQLERIGRMAEARSPDENRVHFVMFRNREGMLKPGGRVTLVVGPARQEHVLLGQ